MNENSQTTFRKIGFWEPDTARSVAVRPGQWKHIFRYPISIRFEETTSNRHASVVRWTYSQETRKRLLLTFSSQSTYRLLSYRWRAVANALGKFIKRHPDREFVDVPVDVSDCTDASVPENTFRFAKLPGDPHELIPNPFLLGTIRRARRPIQWKHKNDSLYFRGALTGDVQSYENPRVAACIAAKKIMNSDCKLSDFPQTPATFLTELKSKGLCTTRDPSKTPNSHRYLLDIDGNTSSWHRFWKIGAFGCVPIRFETRWVECWHKNLKEGKHYVFAKRTTLSDTVASLRAQPEKAMSIAQDASNFVHHYLTTACVQKLFEESWFRRLL